MRKVAYMFIAITGNALGTALMEETNLGMTAWGSSSLNVSNYLGVSLGMGFIILSIFFYIVANIIRKKFIFKEVIFSFVVVFLFGLCTDFFLYLIPNLDSIHVFYKIGFNIFGLLILLFSIAVHLRVNIAVQPMDVYLGVLQNKTNSVALGTYITYFSAFGTGVVFGLLHGHIDGIGIGTIITLLASGYVMKFYNDKVIHNWDFS